MVIHTCKGNPMGGASPRPLAPVTATSTTRANEDWRRMAKGQHHPMGPGLSGSRGVECKDTCKYGMAGDERRVGNQDRKPRPWIGNHDRKPRCPQIGNHPGTDRKPTSVRSESPKTFQHRSLVHAAQGTGTPQRTDSLSALPSQNADLQQQQQQKQQQQ